MNTVSFTIDRRKISEQVFDNLKILIQDGTFPVNTKLPSETELAKMFKISRSPVREALSILSAIGIVEQRQGGGNWVREVRVTDMLEKARLEMLDIEKVYELLELRTIIETEATALAAIRHKQEDIIELEQALYTLKETFVNDDTILGDEADYNFHKIIIRSSYNSFLVQTIENTSELYHKALQFSLKQNIGLKLKREHIYEEHKAIFDAIKARNSKLAALKMRKHLHTVRKKIGDNL